MKQPDLVPAQIYAYRKRQLGDTRPALLLNTSPAERLGSGSGATYTPLASIPTRTTNTFKNGKSVYWGYPVLLGRRIDDFQSLPTEQPALRDLLDENDRLRQDRLPDGIKLELIGARYLISTWADYEAKCIAERKLFEERVAAKEVEEARSDVAVQGLSAFLTSPPQTAASYKDRIVLSLDQAEELLAALTRQTYTVVAKRWKDGWELYIESSHYRGTTQAHDLESAESMARDYIALDRNIQPDSFDVVIIPDPDADSIAKER